MSNKKILHPEQHVRQEKKRKKPRMSGAQLVGKGLRVREKWKKIPETEGKYSVSNYGRVRINNSFTKRGDRQLNLYGPKPYGWVVSLTYGGKKHQRAVRRLVVTAFAPHLENKRLKFKDGDPMNVAAHNLAEKKTTRSGGVLTSRKVANIKRLLLNGGVTQAALARKYKVSASTINAIYKGKRWKSIKPSDFAYAKKNNIMKILKQNNVDLIDHSSDYTYTLLDFHSPRKHHGRYVVGCWCKRIEPWSDRAGRVKESGKCDFCNKTAPKKLTTLAFLLNANEIINV
jgi:hypothetical protein